MTHKSLPESVALKPTDEQAAAAASEARHTLVMAGPGAGKTATLVLRVDNLLRVGTPPSAVIVLAFTRAAAEELQSRMPASLPPGAVRTMHSLATELVVRESAAFGFSVPVSVLGTNYRTRVQEALRNVTNGRPELWSHPERPEILIQRAYERLLDPVQYASTHPSLDLRHKQLLCGIATEFDRATTAAGEVALCRLIPMVVQRMASDLPYTDWVARRWRHVLVDEYQDLDPSQLVFLDRLLTSGAALWAVGDEDQCIYGFKSVDTLHTRDFGARYPDARVFHLTDNHRCARQIVNAAGNLIDHNRARSQKPRQIASREVDGSVSRPSFGSAAEEAAWVATFVAERLAEGLTVAVLARSLYRLDAIRDALGTCAVSVTTVHDAKGHQWDAVIVVGLEEGCSPDFRAQSVDALEEERRIVYVAMTRAGSMLVLSSISKDRTPSRFLRETALIAPWRATRAICPDPDDDPESICEGDVVHILVDGLTADPVIVGLRPSSPLDQKLRGAIKGDTFQLPNGAHVEVRAIERTSANS